MIDKSRFFRFQKPMLPNLWEGQQYVVGRYIDGELYLLYEAHPIQIAPISNKNISFQVFAESDKDDLSSLVSVWFRTCTQHKEDRLEVFTLKSLGISLQD